MRQALHIFLKDSRQFRYPIAVLLAWTALFAAVGGHPWPGVSDRPPTRSLLDFAVEQFAGYLFSIGWCYLVAQVIHAEALAGDKQFWLTRPYHRGSLAMAKALFVLAYVTGPLTLAQAAIVVSSGLPLAPYVAGLLWEQVLITAVVVLPAAAVAAVTRSLPQFVLTGLLLPAFLFLSAIPLALSEHRLGHLEWIRYTVAIGGAALIAVTVAAVQFARRRTVMSRVIACLSAVALAAVAIQLPWPTAFAFQSRVAGDWSGRLTAELVQPVPKGTPRMRVGGNTGVQLFFRLAGVPPEGTVVCEARQVTIEAPGGLQWKTQTLTGFTHLTPEGECPVGLPVDQSFLDAVADRPVTLHAVLYNTVFGAERPSSVPLGQSLPTKTDAGFCVARLYNDAAWLRCRTAFRNAVPLRWSVGQVDYSPFPADLRLRPVSERGLDYGRSVAGAVDVLTVTTRDLLAHVRTTVTAENLRLQDYEFGR